jgi:hypothetical protein
LRRIGTDLEGFIRQLLQRGELSYNPRLAFRTFRWVSRAHQNCCESFPLRQL